MATDNTFTIIGNLTDEPVITYTASGDAVTNFTVAQTPRKFDKDSNQWVDADQPLFMRCSIWRDYAVHVAESLRKGQRVIAIGRLTQRSYEKDGEKRTVVELAVDEVGPSLKFATATVTRAAKGNTNSQGSNDWAKPKGGNQPSHGEAPF